MSRAAILLLGIVAQVALSVLFVMRVVPSIAKDLEVRSASALKNQGINWAKVDVDGRDVTISGLRPSDGQHERAMTALAGVKGVRTVIDDTRALTSKRTEPSGDTLPVLDEERVVDELRTGGDLDRFGLQYVFRVERAGDRVALRGMV
ncbi:MAG: BON domain-containing protein, partial [Pseudomonadota bacterium]